ncbi:MAG: dTMP kinase [Parcubacteria group bacterium]
MSQYPGKFIVFEGGEGTGKTTQIAILAKKLREFAFLPYITREPGGTDCPVAEKIRAILKDPENIIVPEAELFLFLASRAQHVKQCIVPHLEQSDIVISDRFYGSTFAYQHFGRGLFDLNEIKKINEFATGGLEPDLTVLLDIDPAKGLARIAEKANDDRFDSENIEFHRKVRQGFLTLAKLRDHWAVIDADADPKTVHKHIWAKVSDLLNI